MGRKAKKKRFSKQEGILSNTKTPPVASTSNTVKILHGPKQVWNWVLIALVVCIGYGNTLRNDFVHDDRIEILQNTFIRDFSHLFQILTSPAWAFRSEGDQQAGSNYYRPVQYLTYAVLYHFFGANPFGYHLFKLVLHLAVCLLFFWIIRHHWKRPELALSCVLLFAIHPANTEAVAWVSGITDVTCALFFLLTFLFYLRSRTNPSLANLLPFYGLFFVGLFSKETMATSIPVLFLYDWIHLKRFPPLDHWRRFYLPLWVGLVIYLGLRIHAIGSFTSSSQVRYDFLSGLQSLLNQVVLLSKYFATFFFPLSLNAYHLFDPVLSLLDYRVGIALTILIMVLIFFRLVYKRVDSAKKLLLLFGLVWFVVALSPVLLFLKRIGENVFAERYLYLPSLGLCLSVSIALTQLREKMPRTINPGLLILLGLFSWKVIERNRIWHDDLVFYETTVQASPRAAGLLNNLGIVYANMARHRDALKALESSVSVRPNVSACKNLGRIYASVGRFADSETAYQQAATLSPGDAEVYSGLGDLYFAQKRYAEAISVYQKSLVLNPRVLRVYFNLADACINEKRYDEALLTYQRLLPLGPTVAQRAYRGMATVYTAQNLMDKAAEANRMALAAQP